MAATIFPTSLVGSYAQDYYLGPQRKASMTETIAAWKDYLPEFLPLPHPSWRTLAWAKRHPWFERRVIPELRRRVEGCIGQV